VKKVFLRFSAGKEWWRQKKKGPIIREKSRITYKPQLATKPDEARDEWGKKVKGGTLIQKKSRG